MKNSFHLLGLLLLTTMGFAQNKTTEKADALYDTYQYVDAINAYLKIEKNGEADAYVYKQLGNAYFGIYNIDEASKWYAKATKTEQNAETYYNYAQVLKSQGKYEMANSLMDKFSKIMPEDERAKAYLKNPNYIPKLKDKDKQFNIKQTTINDEEQSDFGAVLSNDDVLYFVSTRGNSKKDEAQTRQPYLDIYRCYRNEDGSLSEPEEVKELNTVYHDGPITISKDGKTMYFSRDGHSEGSYKKVNRNKVKLAQQGIYKATLVGNKWDNIQALPINSIDYSVSHPSLSDDGKTLYFASNMPGGLGDTDIWKIKVNQNSYGKPENLGADVNTPSKEGFPFISSDSKLYFASSGMQGLGGFDIFKYDLNKNTKVENLGEGVNTKEDDFSFSLNTENKIGFFSSNRAGVDNIYMAIPICDFQAIVVAKDAVDNSIIPGASVTLVDPQFYEIAAQATNMKGQTSFDMSCDNEYSVFVAADGYESKLYPLDKTNGNKITIDAILKPENQIITDTEVKLNTIYFEFNKSNITRKGAFELDKLVNIMNDYPDMDILVRSHTDSKGTPAYNKELSKQRAESTVQYLISKGIDKNRLTSEGVGSSDPKIKCQPNCTDEEEAQNRRSEFLIVKNK